MPNLHNRYKSAERKISQKNPEYMLTLSHSVLLIVCYLYPYQNWDKSSSVSTADFISSCSCFHRGITELWQ